MYVNTFSFNTSIGIRTNTGECSSQQFINSNRLQSETVCHIRAWHTLLQVRKALVHTLCSTKCWPPTRSGSAAPWCESGICLWHEFRLQYGQALFLWLMTSGQGGSRVCTITSSKLPRSPITLDLFGKFSWYRKQKKAEIIIPYLFLYSKYGN